MLDASAAVSALLNDGPSRRLVVEEQVHAPHLIDSEVAHVLRRHVIARRLAEREGWAALETWSRVGPTRHAAYPLLPRVWDLGDNVSAYDAGYIALAESLDCPLVTADARLSLAPGIHCPVTVVPR